MLKTHEVFILVRNTDVIQLHYLVVYDRNQGPISVSDGIKAEIIFSETKTFLFHFFFTFKLQNFFYFFPPLVEIQVFITFKINQDLQK